MYDSIYFIMLLAAFYLSLRVFTCTLVSPLCAYKITWNFKLFKMECFPKAANCFCAGHRFCPATPDWPLTCFAGCDMIFVLGRFSALFLRAVPADNALPYPGYHLKASGWCSVTNKNNCGKVFHRRISTAGNKKQLPIRELWRSRADPLRPTDHNKS